MFHPSGIHKAWRQTSFFIIANSKAFFKKGRVGASHMVIVPVTLGPYIGKDILLGRKLLKLGKIDPHGGKCFGGKCNPIDLP